MNLHQIESDCYRGNSFETCLENRNLGLFVSASIPYQLVSWLGLVYVCNCTDTDTYFTYRGRYPSFTPVHTCIDAYIGGLGLLIHQEGSIWAQSVTDNLYGVHTPFLNPAMTTWMALLFEKGIPYPSYMHI